MNQSEHSSDGKPNLPDEDIDLVLRSTTTPWGPLACIGHEGGVRPGDWWGAFWWAMEQRWKQTRADLNEDEQVTQTTLAGMGLTQD